ncbi:MAG: MIP family channel protein [Deltaproteobacteria bacterium]|nr:MAG: MIP family channel protein [Deltaproteobacteria bacterium]
MTKRLFQKSVAEAIGTFALVFTGCGGIMIMERFPGTIPQGAIPVIFGLAVAAMIYAVGHISGAHFNPAVTLAFAIARHFPKRDVLFYWIAQFLGAFAAIFLLFLILPEGRIFGATIPYVTLWKALIWEMVLTFFLMFVIIAVATDTRAEGTMAGAAIGATVMLAAFVGGPVTGASMNPARSLAPAIAEGHYENLWIYMIGPMVGAIMAAVLYSWLREEEK